jgi:hypothetical protein
MSVTHCQQLFAEFNNDITLTVYRIFCEAQTVNSINSKDWADLVAGLNDEDKNKMDEVVGNLTHAWVQGAPCENLVALVRWRQEARSHVLHTWI